MQSSPAAEAWERRNERFLAKFRGKKLLVTYSGGKDSSVCVSLLSRARQTYGFDLEAHLYAFPRHLYGSAYRNGLEAYWKGQGVSLVYHEASPADPEIRGLPNPCVVCQAVRKRALARLFTEVGVEPTRMVIVSGHSLWDLAGYAIEHLIGSELANPKGEKGLAEDRFREIAQRFYPYLEMKAGFAVYRPLHFLNQQEIRALRDEAGAPPADTACEYGESRPKKVLAKYFEKFGLEFSYDRVMEFAHRHLELGRKDSVEGIDREEFLGKRF